MDKAIKHSSGIVLIRKKATLIQTYQNHVYDDI
jgi:hypothetical protein